MKKQTLLGAVALTTIAVAGQAGAGTLTAAVTPNSTVSENVVVANDFTLDDDASAGIVGLAFKPSSGVTLPAGNSILSVELKGGATFGDEVDASAVVKVAGATCAPTSSIISGGRSADKTVTFLVSTLNGCTSANPLLIELPVLLDGTNTAVNVEAGMKPELGNVIDGGVASTKNPKAAAGDLVDLISFANAISVTTLADAGATYATLDSKFKALGGDDVLGTFQIEVEGYALGIDDVANVADIADVTKAVLTLKGDFSTVEVLADGVEFEETKAGSGTATVTFNNPGDAEMDITVDELASTPVIKGSHYSLSAQLTAPGYKTAALAIPAVQIQNLSREGAAYLLPWVASGTLATSSTSNTVVRLSNIGTEATGPVSIELLTSSAGTPASTSLVQVAASIAKGGELVLTSGDFENKLGANFGRGDIRVTVEGQPSSLIVRRFVQSTTTGALSEVSLGRTSDDGFGQPIN